MASGIQLKPTDAANSTFHVTSHGVGDLRPFFNVVDKREFIDRFKFYLSSEPYTDRSRRPYEKLIGQDSLLAFCILDNHFHALVHQTQLDGMRRLFTRVLASYGRYYNFKYSRRGPIFDGRYAARPVVSFDHAKRVITYIHLNDPIQQFDNPFSSHGLYLDGRQRDWLDVEAGLRIYGGIDGYRDFTNRNGERIVASKLQRWGIDPTLHPYRPF